MGVGRNRDEVAVGFTTLPPLTTWDHSGSKLLCSAEGPARTACNEVERLVALLVGLCGVGVRLASAAFASFHLALPWFFAVWFPPQLQHLSCCSGVEQSGTSHKQHTGVSIRSCAACRRSAGSVCTEARP